VDLAEDPISPDYSRRSLRGVVSLADARIKGIVAAHRIGEYVSKDMVTFDEAGAGLTATQ
jgi:hypothetical protein